jgi:hypothetical protein
MTTKAKIGSKVTHKDIRNCYGTVTRVTDDGKLVVDVGGRLGFVCGVESRWRVDSE